MTTKMDQSKLSTDLRLALCVGERDHYPVVVHLLEAVDLDIVRKFGEVRLGADKRVIALDLTVEALADLSQQSWVESVSSSYDLRPLSG